MIRCHSEPFVCTCVGCPCHYCECGVKYLVITGVGKEVFLGVPCDGKGGSLRGDLVHLLSRLHVALCVCVGGGGGTSKWGGLLHFHDN